MIKQNIPNTVTCCNLLSGCIAVRYALIGDPTVALTWIIIGAVFDFFDGMTARLLKVSSPIGKELDSLADDITFGVAPSAILFYHLGVIDYPAALESLRPYVPYFAFIMAAFSALRLAKFNIDVRQTTSFIGLPTPANALFWGSLIVASPAVLTTGHWALPIMLVLILASSILLVCELPMFALKFKHWRWKGNEIKYIFAILTVINLALFGILRGWWVVIALYFFISVGDDVLKLKAKKLSTNNRSSL